MSTEITQVAGRAVPVRGNDIDTDRIIPARFLRCVTFDGLGEHAFADDRAELAGGEQVHPFDDPRFAGANVLVVNRNFGCGSSREHAPQSLLKWGISAIIGISFAEIFYNNNIALGVPCLQVTPEEADALQSAIEADPNLVVTVDVAAGDIRYADQVISATIPDGVQQRFVSGQWDATGQLLSGADQVAATAKVLPYVGGFAD